jgi:hypothetical protein
MFVTAFTRACRWNVSGTSRMQYIASEQIYLRYVLILTSHILTGLISIFFTYLGVSDNNFICMSNLPHAFYIFLGLISEPKKI